jgi:SRSO17 transposase
MTHGDETECERFGSYVERLSTVVGHADRREPLRQYLTGLLLAGERKSVEPMAAKIDPAHVQARHQSMHHFVANAPWDAEAVLRVASDYALAQLERHAPVAAWVVDDTGMPKQGRHSVGVARQYCGVLGKQANCQVAVSVSLVNEVLSVPCAYRLYLPEAWAADRQRRAAAGVPHEVRFQKKWEIALEAIDQLRAEGLPPAPVVADAGYGVAVEFRDALRKRGLLYAVAVTEDTSVWPPGQEPLPPEPPTGRGRRATRLRRTQEHHPVSVRELAATLPAELYETVRWRQGTRGRMVSRFAAVRVRPAHRDTRRKTPRPVEWLLIEWPEGHKEPSHYWLSTAAESAALEDLVRLVQVRWRIERDFQELKDEIGLDHYEGRGWRGFHHHGVLCLAAYAFLAAERARLSPPLPVSFLQAAALPEAFQPRGAPPAPSAP